MIRLQIRAPLFHSRLTFKPHFRSHSARDLVLAPPITEAAPSPLFPYRMRPGQDRIVDAVAAVARTEGALLLDAPTGFGKTVSVLAPLLEHAEREDHKILYLVRTYATELQVLSEIRAISHRLDHPILASSLQGRQRRCFLLENVAEIKGATAEEHGKLCADRKRATQRSFDEGRALAPPPELPESTEVDLTDLDGCAYYARVLQSDLIQITDRFAAKPATSKEFDDYCRNENFCPYELAKKVSERSRLVTAPYSFFFHPHIRRSLFEWIGAEAERVDLILDEAQNLAERLRDLATVSLPQESVRRARAELFEHGDFPLPEGPTAVHFVVAVQAELDSLLDTVMRGDDALLSDSPLEQRISDRLGGDLAHFETWLGALVSWGEALRDERRRDRRLPRSWVHSVALTLLSWPQLAAPEYVKVVQCSPGRALEAFPVDVREAAAPIRECHVSIHMAAALAPLEEYRDVLGLGSATRLLEVPSFYPEENRRFFYDPSLGIYAEGLFLDPTGPPRLADRLAEVLQFLPVRTLVLFPTFELMERTLHAGLSSALPPGAVIEGRRLAMGDLWRPIDGLKREPEGVVLGVAGGRVVEGIDFRDEDFEAVVIVGVPFPKPTVKREALEEFREREAPGRGSEYVRKVPARRAIVQAVSRMIRSEHDRGLTILLDPRAEEFETVLPGLERIRDLYEVTRRFYGRRARFNSAPPSPSHFHERGPTEPETLSRGG